MTLKDICTFARHGITLDSISGILDAEQTAKAFEELQDFEELAVDYMNTDFIRIRIDKAI